MIRTGAELAAAIAQTSGGYDPTTRLAALEQLVGQIAMTQEKGNGK